MVLASLGKYVGGKVLTAALIVASAGGIIWFWKHPEQLAAIWSVMKTVLVWLGLVTALPWACYFVTGWIVKRDSNLAAALLLAGLTAADVVLAIYLAGWHVSGALTWTVFLLGFLCAAIYNFVVCDFQAGRFEDGL
jgi:hypothetical protein